MMRFAFALLAVSAAVSAQDKPYRLFVGMNLQLLEEGGGRREVSSVGPRDVVLAEPERPTVPLSTVNSFSWKYVTKVSGSPVMITDFEHHLAYSLRNDKALHYMASQNAVTIHQQDKADQASAAAYQAAVRNGVDIQVAASISAAAAQGIEVISVTAGNQGAVAVEAANIAVDNQYFETNNRLSDPDFIERAQGAAAGAEGGHDVLELEFDIAAPTEIADAYLVVHGKISFGDVEGEYVFPHPVGAIGPKARSIRIRRVGFPAGFEFKDPQVYVFTHGKELATNLSQRAVEFSREELEQFLFLSQAADHALGAAPPEPVWTLAPASLLAAESPQPFDREVVVNVSPAGRVFSIHDSETAARTHLAQHREDALTGGPHVQVAGGLNPALERVLTELVFLPAIDLGTPVAGTAKVNVANFFR